MPAKRKGSAAQTIASIGTMLVSAYLGFVGKNEPGCKCRAVSQLKSALAA